ncbi:short-chain dehydrogenase/reductase SDR [Halorhabdus utahensis DSM 12940]|uniref:Short-chain dehydrogenase/reductase SDR n=1 Tax=Halorhabdus utahensis (strain DSM 12940 / JCM 11049 / AX-2) TaxID=519442 RepID=C7NSM9_HALUD|nr:short-chain dehydrogenase/reductase SDR [Halorhabdus utahensis DSM 12940]
MMSSETWGPEAMGDQSEKTVVVTGANSGIGFEVTKAFAENGARVVMACRSLDRGNAASEEIRAAVADPSLSVMELDLADLDSVRSFAETFRTEYSDLHVLSNNAGVMAIPRSETEDGFETQFGVNHLGHFALTGLLLDRLRETAGETRIVTQSSGLHERGEIDFADLHGEQSYDRFDAYAQSKLANVLFAYELDRRLRAANAEVTSVACHPGFAATNLQRRGPELAGSKLRLWMMKLANAVFAQSAATGALPMLMAGTDADVAGGEYVGPGGLMNMRGAPVIQRSSDRSYDDELARQLWDVSVDLTGVSYDLPDPQAPDATSAN